jgi:hypothetical protein
MSAELAASARRAIDALDTRGAWVDSGRLRADGQPAAGNGVISTQTLIRNLQTISSFVAASE